jgi:hypothetical protein
LFSTYDALEDQAAFKEAVAIIESCWGTKHSSMRTKAATGTNISYKIETKRQRESINQDRDKAFLQDEGKPNVPGDSSPAAHAGAWKNV